MPTVPDAAEASAAAEGYNAGAAARQATLQKLQTLQSRLAQVSLNNGSCLHRPEPSQTCHEVVQPPAVQKFP